MYLASTRGYGCRPPYAIAALIRLLSSDERMNPSDPTDRETKDRGQEDDSHNNQGPLAQLGKASNATCAQNVQRAGTPLPPRGFARIQLLRLLGPTLSPRQQIISSHVSSVIRAHMARPSALLTCHWT